MAVDIDTFCKLKGYRVRLKVNNEEYEGTITNVIVSTLCVALGKARCLKDGAFYHILYFYTYEIESCIALNGPEDLKKIPLKQNSVTEEDGPRLVKLRPLPFHERGKPQANVETNNLLIEGLGDKSQSEYLLDDLSDKSDDDDDDVLPSEKFKYSIPRTNITIDTIDDNFRQAITNIMKEIAVGVSLEGGNIGRHGKICWISVSTESHVYLFDICTLGKDAFSNGLKDVLQNPNILKIFHDCREPSDALFHLYGIRLINIFDTQSSDALLQYKLHNRMPQFVRSLGACLLDYLKLDIKVPDFSRTHNRQYSKQNDLSVWIHRPLPKRLAKAAAKRCMFLKELRFAILERYIADLNRGTEIYLGIVRDSSEQELDLSRSTLHVLPAAFERLQVKGKKGFNVHQSFETPLVDSSCYELSDNITDPYVAASKALWLKKNITHTKEPAKEEISDETSQKSFEDKNHKDNRSRNLINGKLETHKSLPETSCSLFAENSASAKCENQSYNASSQSEKQLSDVTSRTENRCFARSSPRKRIDWPKISSQRSNGTANVTMIPAGMIPSSVQYPKKKQGS